MSETYAPTRRSNKVADWVETTALSRRTSLGSDLLHQLGRDVGYSQSDVALGLTTMSRRASLLEAAYPFRVGGGGAAATADPHTAPWTALLLMSAESPARRALDIPAAAAHLERVTASALRSLFGPGTSSLRFGAGEEGRPAAFSEAIKWLAGMMHVPVGTAYRPPHGKDGGVDVVAWRPFPDRRSGFPVLLAQCTLEKDFVQKAADVDVRVWAGYLRLDIEPYTALAIPDVVPAGEEWNALAAKTVVLDRVRLAAMIPQEAHLDDDLRPVSRWAEERLELMRAQE